ncbi:MAG: adenine phosphoribosyltransferase [Clostridiales bacterium]|jgi:adenine phosphoribosyltransferase|nr:adenine phosphoribosyltransferase [Clostridiales bacterium]MDN5297801.1 adenine phosphoribosyltransferase [Clostridiales bacterium]
MDFKSKIRVVEDFPVKGISFKDITTLLQDGEAYAAAIDEMAAMVEDLSFDVVVGPEARGFLTGAPLSILTKTGFVPIRKPGKLPYDTIQHAYALEYGTDTLEIHADAIQKGMKVLIVDDLLATGGTSKAVCELIEKLGGEVVGLAFLIELDFLGGRSLLDGYHVKSLVHYEA